MSCAGNRRVRLRWAITAALLLIIAFVVVLAIRQPFAVQSTLPGQGTVDPRIIVNLTQLPHATALSGQEANILMALQVAVEACPAYTAERREQMITQIGFIINPSLLPRDVIIVLGANPRGRLLSALAQVTKIQWQLGGKPADSCLLQIGKQINDLLAADGAPTEEAYAN